MSLTLLDNLITHLTKLPGIGPRTAERIAFHLLKMNSDEALALAEAIRQIKLAIKPCSVCCNLTDRDPCAICLDPRRDHSVVCVVEQPKDVATLEASGAYNGVYHVLMGYIAPLEGAEPEDLTIPALIERVRSGKVKEVIMATNPTMEGDGTALHIASMLKGTGVKITRLARGLAVGSQLEFASKATLSDALTERREL